VLLKVLGPAKTHTSLVPSEYYRGTSTAENGIIYYASLGAPLHLDSESSGDGGFPEEGRTSKVVSNTIKRDFFF
jgi:hypothetical protein